MRYALFLSVIYIAITCINSAKILGVFHMAAYSHYQLGDKILKELAAKGHEVTVITPYEEKTPIKNFKQILLTGVLDKTEDLKGNLFDYQNIPAIGSILWLDLLGLDLVKDTLEHPAVVEFLKRDEKFDVIIMEQFINEAFRGFCYRYNAPCIVVSTFGASRWSTLQMGSPNSPSYIPDMSVTYSSQMTFFQRTYNTFVYSFAVLFFHLYTLRKHNEVLQKYFPGAPPIEDLYYNTSLMLMNSHVSTNLPVPLVPNIIEIGGYHIKPPKPLPKDLKDYLDNAKEGVILFSMGSNLKSRDIPIQKRDAILKSFAKLKQKVLWKFEDENLPNQPPNLKISKWLPQQDILAHPNVKLFITHGGLLSGLETIYHGVPIIGIPIFGDQQINVANAAIAGYALKVPYEDLCEESLTNALTEILSNPKYAENAKTRSKIMHDVPMKPLDKAMFWIEYVIRHKGASHLRTAALNLNWYQYLLLDVVAFYIGAALLGCYLFCKMVKRFCCKKCSKQVPQAKKKN